MGINQLHDLDTVLLPIVIAIFVYQTQRILKAISSYRGRTADILGAIEDKQGWEYYKTKDRKLYHIATIHAKPYLLCKLRNSVQLIILQRIYFDYEHRMTIFTNYPHAHPNENKTINYTGIIDRILPDKITDWCILMFECYGKNIRRQDILNITLAIALISLFISLLAQNQLTIIVLTVISVISLAISAAVAPIR